MTDTVASLRFTAEGAMKLLHAGMAKAKEMGVGQCISVVDAGGHLLAFVRMDGAFSQSIDTSLTLPDDQDALIAAVAAANPRTVVVLQTGGPVLMPWLDHVQAVLEAWYPGSAGGEAIANILFGRVNPSGHLPVTFPRGEDQLPRPVLEGVGHTPQQPFTVTYSEGAAVGYRWFDARGLEP